MEHNHTNPTQRPNCRAGHHSHENDKKKNERRGGSLLWTSDHVGEGGLRLTRDDVYGLAIGSAWLDRKLLRAKRSYFLRKFCVEELIHIDRLPFAEHNSSLSANAAISGRTGNMLY